jgi:hypothetical protein
MQKEKIIPIAIATRDRDVLTTVDLMKDVPGVSLYLFVDNLKQKKNLMGKYADKCSIVNMNTKGGIVPARNYIMDYFGKGKRIVFMCDDVQSIEIMIDGKLRKLNSGEIKAVIDAGFGAMDNRCAKLWGVYPVPNSFYMKLGIAECAFIIATFCGIEIDDFRFNEKRVWSKEDYVLSAEMVLRYGKVARFNDVCVRAKHYSKGGAESRRTDKSEAKQCKYIMEDYPAFFKINKARKRPELLMRNLYGRN